MKNIVVLIYDLTVEYHITIMDGISSFFKDKKDVNLLITPACIPHATTFGFDYQYWTSVELLKSKQIDAIIVVVNSFLNYITQEQLAVELKGLEGKPIVSIAAPLKLKNNYHTSISTKKIYCQLVEHLVEKHYCGKLAFFSAALVNSPESEERLESFKYALEKNNLEFHPEWVFDGDFTPAISHRFILDHFKKKEDLPFDAILCANDYMAGGCIAAFEANGIRVPEDVCVIGFDDSEIALSNCPTISTVNQHIEQSAYEAARVAYDLCTGKQVKSKNITMELEPIYRQSCGCIAGREKTNSYFDQKGIFHPIASQRGTVFNLFESALNDMSSIYHMLNLLESVSDINNYFNIWVTNCKLLRIENMAVCIYDKKIELAPDEDFVLPKKARLLFLYDKANNVVENYYPDKGPVFNPLETIIPVELDSISQKKYYILPLSLHNINYGYVISQILEDKYTVYEIYLKIIINSLVRAYEFSYMENQQKLLKATNTNLEVASKTDELTKLFNRRGFMEYAQVLLDLTNDTDVHGAIFFFDMDGLKRINDTYGHKNGDKAIQTLSAALKKTFRKADIVARLSGDEFVACVPGYDLKNVPVLRERIQKECDLIAAKKKLKFKVSVSAGVVEYSRKNNDLQKLLLMADKELYKEKKIKHSKDSN
ncbi:MAG: GGDEF domain-containing protein [Treponema sp.]|nr:GGDEF domain-containing protein [Treponema sp.]